MSIDTFQVEEQQSDEEERITYIIQSHLAYAPFSDDPQKGSDKLTLTNIGPEKKIVLKNVDDEEQYQTGRREHDSEILSTEVEFAEEDNEEGEHLLNMEIQVSIENITTNDPDSSEVSGGQINQLEEEFENFIIVEASEMLRCFESKKSQSKHKKATNIPKWIFNLLIDRAKQLNLGYRHLRWISSLDKKGANKSHNRFALIALLCENEFDSLERVQWKKLHREILSAILSCDRLKNILQNGSIPAGNKLHYLYYSKVFECRLNSALLLEHIQ